MLIDQLGYAAWRYNHPHTKYNSGPRVRPDFQQICQPHPVPLRDGRRRRCMHACMQETHTYIYIMGVDRTRCPDSVRGRRTGAFTRTVSVAIDIDPSIVVNANTRLCRAGYHICLYACTRV
ncbi:hypothetical protein ABW21_db0203736 [Orbilia brochopaga]|nr:hypothetical protein ABW21_db0203736 [Drechslerella brochopaga]